jgi:hypothetical protein
VSISGSIEACPCVSGRGDRLGDLGRWAFGSADPLHRRDEAIAAAGQGLNKPRTAGCIFQRFADAVDSGVDAMFVVDEGAVGPEFARDLLARQQLAGPVYQHQEHLERLGIELDANALAAKLTRSGVCFKCSEAIAPRWPWVRHLSCPMYPITGRNPSRPVSYRLLRRAR